MTLMYASPEQVRGDAVLVASDVYQVGALLYELLTERPPQDLQGLALEQAVEQVLNHYPERPSRLNPKVPRDLEQIVLRAMQKDPKLRYASVQELRDDLECFLEGRPVRAVEPSSWYIASRFIQRNKAMMAVVAASFLSLAGATLFSLAQADRARQEAGRSAATQEILADVFTQADPFDGNGAGVSLAEALRAAQPRIATRVANDPELSWAVHKTLSNIYTELGLTEQEAQAFRAMLEAARSVNNDERALLAIAGLGNLLARTDPAAAVKLLSKELAEAPRSSATATPWLFGQYALVGAQRRLQNFEAVKSGAARMQATVDQFSIESPRLRGQLHQTLAGVARREGKAEQELMHWREALRFARATERLSTIAVAASNYGIALMRHGDPVGSEAAFAEAIALYEDAGHQDASLASILRNYAGLLFRTNRPEQAVATSEQALELLKSDTQAYSRFVTGLNLLYYTFALGETAKTVVLAHSVMRDSLQRLGDNASVRDRSRGILAKLFTFADLPGIASRALGFDRCLNQVQLYQALDAYERPQELENRTQLWADAAAGTSWAKERFSSLTFFDVQDQLRLATVLANEEKSSQSFEHSAGAPKRCSHRSR